MHPAYSAAVFTTLSGAGFGLFVWIAAAIVTGHGEQRSGLFALFVAVALVVAGLASSALHLARPSQLKSALRMLRSSWAAREGVLALANLPLAAALAAVWIGMPSSPVLPLLAIVVAALALATVAATAEVYAAEASVPAWSQPLVLPLFLLLALLTGGAIACLIAGLARLDVGQLPYKLEIGFLAVSCALKLMYWRAIDTAAASVASIPTQGSAHPARTTDPLLTRSRTVMLRGFVLASLFALPAVTLLFAVSAPQSVLSPVSLVVAAVSIIAGVGAERRLFIAEARRVSTGGADGVPRATGEPRRWP